MTKTISVNEVSPQSVIDWARNGDEIVLEENGTPIAKITPVMNGEAAPAQQRVLGLGAGKGYFMSDDFDDELPDDFWGFDKEL